MELHNENYWTDQFRRGNEQALEYYFRKHHKPLFYFTTKLTRDQNIAEEIVSETFIKLWNKHQNFDNPQHIKSFLYLASRNASFDHLKTSKRKTQAQEKYLSQYNEAEELILFEYMQTEIMDVLQKEIEALPGKCQQIFKLIYLENKKTDEIAELLNLSVQTVRNQKTKAIELIRTSLMKKGISSALTIAILTYLSSR